MRSNSGRMPAQRPRGWRASKRSAQKQHGRLLTDFIEARSRLRPSKLALACFGGITYVTESQRKRNRACGAFPSRLTARLAVYDHIVSTLDVRVIRFDAGIVYWRHRSGEGRHTSPPTQAARLDSGCVGCREDIALAFEFEDGVQPIVDLSSGSVWGYEALGGDQRRIRFFSPEPGQRRSSLLFRPSCARYGDRNGLQIYRGRDLRLSVISWPASEIRQKRPTHSISRFMRMRRSQPEQRTRGLWYRTTSTEADSARRHDVVVLRNPLRTGLGSANPAGLTTKARSPPDPRCRVLRVLRGRAGYRAVGSCDLYRPAPRLTSRPRRTGLPPPHSRYGSRSRCVASAA
jgi:hypothetical protein